jgi:hypothetical protein
MLRFVVFLAFFAAVVYAFFWLLERRNQGGGGNGGHKPVPRGPVGPDDDEDFLRKLDWEQRRTRHPRDEEP